jgi:hypothetical protein
MPARNRPEAAPRAITFGGGQATVTPPAGAWRSRAGLSFATLACCISDTCAESQLSGLECPSPTIHLSTLRSHSRHDAQPCRPLARPSIITVVQMDEDGRPAFSPGVASTIVHEFSHSFVNPVIDSALPALEPAGRAILDHFGDRMRPQGYPETRHVLAESVVQAAVARYRLANDGEAVARREQQRQRALGFLWIDDVYEILGEFPPQVS